MKRNPWARITNVGESDIIVEHLSNNGDWILVSNEDGVNPVRISPEAVPELVKQLQNLVLFLNPMGPVSSRWR